MVDSSETENGNSDPEPEEVAERAYVPKAAIALRASADGGYQVTLSPLVKRVPGIDVGDYVQIWPDGSAADGDQPMLMFGRVDDVKDEPRGGQNVRKILRSSESNIRVNVPPKYVTPKTLGVETDSYTNKDPLIFEPVLGEDGESFGLMALGFASELFVHPDHIEYVRFPTETTPKRWSTEELADYTSYDPTAGAESTHGSFSIAHAQQLYSQLNSDDSELGSADDVPKSFIIPDNDVSDKIFYRRPNRWKELKKSSLESCRRRLQTILTPTLLTRTDHHSGYDPLVVERQGTRYEIHFISLGSLVHVGSDIFGVPEGIGAVIRWQHNKAGNQFVEELYAARGEHVPDDHRVLAEDYDLLVLPVGEAEVYPDSQIAINVIDRESTVLQAVVNGHATTAQQAIDTATRDTDVGTAVSDESGADETPSETPVDTSSGTSATASTQATFTEVDDTTDQDTPAEETPAEETPARETSDQETGGQDTSPVREESVNTAFWKLRPFDRDELVQLRNEGHDPEEIADELDTKESVIRSSLAQLE